MKKQLIYMALALPLLLGSCAEWLDVPPPSSVSAEELFETEEGFQEAVVGLYTSAVTYNLYGGVFSIEMLDAMMQNYSYSLADPTNYMETAGFDYTFDMTRARFDMIWEAAYKTVANCNLILSHIDEKREDGTLTSATADIVEAEALAMRAYLHFDMLRLCAPMNASASTNASQPAIPYVTIYSKNVTPLSTGEQAIGQALEDLNRAKELLAGTDPILDPAYVVDYPRQAANGVTPEQNITIGDEPLPDFLRNRRHRMNYYAVCGTLARVYLWKASTMGDTEAWALAALNANEVIASNKFKWVSSGPVSAQPNTDQFDRVMYTELVFAFYMDNEDQIRQLNDRFDNVDSGYYVETTTLNVIYEQDRGGAEDLRRRAWFRPVPNSENSRIIKYLRNGDEIGNLHDFVSPAIRLSEMWYILAECRNSGADLGVDSQGTGLAGDPWATLQTVRDHREVKLLLSPAYDFTDELLKEYRKETYCEGQAFLNYKRLNHGIVRQNPYTIYGPDSRDPKYSKGIYHLTVSNSSMDWLPETETNNRAN